MPEAVRRSLPNGLTMLRLVLAAAFFATLNAYRYPDENVVWAHIAVWLFVLAAVTDAFDGYLARKWDATSTFGRIMDPFCDKVLVLGGFIYMAGPRFLVPQWVEEGSFFTMATGIYPWMVAVMLARELLVTGFRGEAEAMGVSFGSNWWGKWKMILQSITIPTVIFFAITFKTGEDRTLSIAAKWFCYVLVYLTVIVTIGSGLPYVVRLRQIVAKRDDTNDAGS
ncbi:MAG: CDP-alcohol phosphatidyltransferase family protein [Planctomycetota bacterium]|jgi:CDP-diacylglycerol--glycerol-3-phosphate 3-phosphatidyltransferase